MVFVTGGTGLVGSHLILELLKAGKSVKALKRPNSNIALVDKLFEWNKLDADQYMKKLFWVDGDLLDPVSIDEAIGEIKEVYHCAGMVSFKPSDRLKMIEYNVGGTTNLVNACLERGVEKFCHVSSVAAFGQAVDGKTIDEETTRTASAEHSGYSISKYLSELEVWRAISEGLSAVIVNPSIIIGPANWKKGSSLMFGEVAKGMKFYITGSTGFVDVRDVVSIMIELMEKKIFGQGFCLNAENLSFREVFTEIAKTLDVKPPSIEAEPWMIGLARYIETIKSKIINTEPRVTKESARSALSKTSYSNKKIAELLEYKFVPVKESINHTGKLFRTEP
ncbi:MAG: NAD-dependent epimerase/dehydratase family protein [Bacteroidota bacterium]|nr:NAD-dependent epimerase/dehydratase family protein [Bacteroidota bacterium]